MKRVTVFGGSLPLPGEPAYLEAVRLGRLLAQAGWTVLTGGYIGTMEAVSRGAAEAGGHVIGVTCTEIENYRTGKANPWVHEVVHRETLRERIHTMMTECDAALALPGGVGTLTEVAFMWNHLLTGATPPRPLILIGSGWKDTLAAFLAAQDRYVPAAQRSLLSYAPNIEAAVDRLADILTSA